MTTTDVKISTDDDGTEHWERQFTPTSATDRITVRRQVNDTGTGYFLNYSDATEAPGSDDGASPGAFKGMIASVSTLGSLDPGTLFQDTAVCYFDPIDTDLSDVNGTFDGYRFDFEYSVDDLTIGSVLVPELVVDWWDGGISGDIAFRPASGSDTTALLRISVEDTGTEIVPAIDAIPPVSTVRHEIRDELTADGLALILAASDVWAVRFRVPQSSVFSSTSGPARSVFLPIPTVDDGGNDYSPRVVIQYTVNSQTTEPPPPPAPRYHNARQVLDAHRQPAILIGRRPFGRRFNRN